MLNFNCLLEEIYEETGMSLEFQGEIRNTNLELGIFWPIGDI